RLAEIEAVPAREPGKNLCHFHPPPAVPTARRPSRAPRLSQRRVLATGDCRHCGRCPPTPATPLRGLARPALRLPLTSILRCDTHPLLGKHLLRHLQLVHTLLITISAHLDLLFK